MTATPSAAERMSSTRLPNVFRYLTADSDRILLQILFVGVATLLLPRWQTLTGDETRYLMYSVSILEHGRFVMTLPEWQHLWFSITGNQTKMLPAGDQFHTVLFNSVYLSAVLSPIAELFSLPGLRAVTLCAGFGGLLYVWRLCRRFSSRGTAIFGVAVAALTIPLIGYLHLFYMETYLFALIACAWERLQKTDRSLTGDLLTGLIIVVIPFVHLRGSVIAAALLLMLTWQIYRRGFVARAVVVCMLGITGLALLIALNLMIYGVIAGPVNHARPPLPWQWFQVASMQLFSVHHGLLAYAPIWIAGYGGLIAGTLRRSKLAREGLVLAAIAGFTGIGAHPGECWTARFWVSSVPMLTVGFCTWWNMAQRPAIRLVSFPLLVVTFANSVLFELRPNLFLDNRMGSATYQRLFDDIGHFNPALVLPAEIYASPYLKTAELMMSTALCVAGLMAVIVLWRRAQAFCSIAAILIMFAGADLTRASIISQQGYSRRYDKDTLVVTLQRPLKAGYVQLGDVSPSFWYTSDGFELETRDAQNRVAIQRFPANQVISIGCRSDLHQITIKDQGSLDISRAARLRLVVYRSDSLLMNSLGIGVPRC